jgi:hypothetical protein
MFVSVSRQRARPALDRDEPRKSIIEVVVRVSRRANKAQGQRAGTVPVKTTTGLAESGGLATL